MKSQVFKNAEKNGYCQKFYENQSWIDSKNLLGELNTFVDTGCRHPVSVWVFLESKLAFNKRQRDAGEK